MSVFTMNKSEKTISLRKVSKETVARAAPTKLGSVRIRAHSVFGFGNKLTFSTWVATLLLLLTINLSETSTLVRGQVVMGGNMNGKITKEVVCHACGATGQREASGIVECGAVAVLRALRDHNAMDTCTPVDIDVAIVCFGCSTTTVIWETLVSGWVSRT